MLVVDYSFLASRSASSNTDEMKDKTLTVPVSVIQRIEEETRKNHEVGFVALSELKFLKKMWEEEKISLDFSGSRLRDTSDSDSDVRNIAKMEGGTVLTSDSIQNDLCISEGIDSKLFMPDERPKLSVSKYFKENVMSVHFREGIPIYIKEGGPSGWQRKEIGKELSTEEIEEVAREVIEKTNKNPDAFIEIDKEGATVVQYEDFRIAIARPPFSDGMEITFVKPVRKLSLSDYKLHPQLFERLESHAEGILVSGSPGAGKTTFAQALAEFYADKGKTVKTMESPRDLNVSKRITQYSPLEGSMVDTSEILLLARPDYTIYDEVRKTSDFEVFMDMRLAGVGMIGVTHASKPIDAIQRFLKRVDMGIIPQIVDTVVFIIGGKVGEVYTLRMTVKVPRGMMEADLARPVVEVIEFFSNKVRYEIFTFGEETTIVPVSETDSTKSGAQKLAAAQVERKVASMLPGVPIKAEMVSGQKAKLFVPESEIAHLIGKGGERIKRLERELGIRIDVEKGEGAHHRERLSFEMSQNKRSIKFIFDRADAGKYVDIVCDGEIVESATVSRKGTLSLGKRSESGKMILKARNVEVMA
jgi:ATPase